MENEEATAMDPNLSHNEKFQHLEDANQVLRIKLRNIEMESQARLKASIDEIEDKYQKQLDVLLEGLATNKDDCLKAIDDRMEQQKIQNDDMINSTIETTFDTKYREFAVICDNHANRIVKFCDEAVKDSQDQIQTHLEEADDRANEIARSFFADAEKQNRKSIMQQLKDIINKFENYKYLNNLEIEALKDSVGNSPSRDDSIQGLGIAGQHAAWLDQLKTLTLNK